MLRRHALLPAAPVERIAVHDRHADRHQADADQLDVLVGERDADDGDAASHGRRQVADGKPDAEDHQPYDIADQAERMSKLINDLLSLSKIEMNANATPIAKVDLLRIVRSEKQHFEWACKQKNVTLRLKLNDNLPPTKGDDEELAQVVRNLIGNAVKYTNPDTEIVLTAKLTSQLPDDPLFRNVSRAICFSVQDHGEGIAKEHLPRLTERFYRVDKSRSRETQGTGLGLAIVKHVLLRHGSTLQIKSEAGKGSSFIVCLPKTAIVQAQPELLLQ